MSLPAHVQLLPLPLVLGPVVFWKYGDLMLAAALDWMGMHSDAKAFWGVVHLQPHSPVDRVQRLERPNIPLTTQHMYNKI